jgi:hypothetical protein
MFGVWCLGFVVYGLLFVVKAHNGTKSNPVDKIKNRVTGVLHHSKYKI